MALATLAEPALGARPIDVSARTSIELNLDARGLELVASGILRDNSGAGIPHRVVTLAFLQQGASSVATDTVRSGIDGRFRSTRRLDAGQWTVDATFPGEAFLAPSTATSGALLEVLEATIVGGPPVVVSGNTTRFSFSLSAEFMGASLTGDGLSIVSDGADVAEQSPGLWVASVHELSAPWVTLVAFADPGGAGRSARQEWRVRRALDARATAQVVDLSTSFLQPRDVRVAATVLDSAGALPGMSASLIVGGHLVASATTDDDGHASVAAADSMGDAVLSVSLPDGSEVARVPVALPAKRALPNLGGAAVLAAALALLGFIALAWLRDVRPHPVVSAPRAKGGAAEAISFELRAPATEVSTKPRFAGVVLDAETGLPLNAVLSFDGVAVSLDADGRFDVPAADWQAKTHALASAAGYRELRATFGVPTANHHVVLRLTPLRVELVEIMRSAVASVAPKDIDAGRWWGTATIGEAWRATAETVRGLQRSSTRSPVAQQALSELLAAVEQQPRRHEAAEALGRLVERGYFGRDPVTESDLAQARVLAAIITEDP